MAPVCLEMGLLIGIVEASPMAGLGKGLNVPDKRVQPWSARFGCQGDEVVGVANGLVAASYMIRVSAVTETMILVVCGSAADAAGWIGCWVVSEGVASGIMFVPYEPNLVCQGG
jgi:hypothetical protein